MRAGRASAALAIGLAMSACSTQTSDGSFASYAGVLGCADVVAWGTVMDSAAVDEGLEVTFDVDQWVYPSAGTQLVTFLADDPAHEVAAPSWPQSDDEVLVIVSDSGPTQRLDPSQGEQAVQQWRDAGSPRLSDEQCEQT